MGQLTHKYYESKNLKIVNDARLAWTSSPDGLGASKAEAILQQLDYLSPAVEKQAKALETEISSRIKVINDREFKLKVLAEENANKLRLQQEENSSKLKLSVVNAVSNIATAFVKSRPRIIRHIHWW